MYGLHADLQTAVNDDAGLTGALLLSLGRFGASTLYRTTHAHDLAWNSQTWVADALIGSIDDIPMPGRFAATSWTINLSGIDAQSQGAFERQEASVYLVLISGDPAAVIGDALMLGRGAMSIQPLVETGRGVVQPIAVELFWNRGTRPQTHARTQDSQRQRYSGDHAFRSLAKQREVVIGGAGVNIFR